MLIIPINRVAGTKFRIFKFKLMRNTLPLSSLPLQILLTFETYYQFFLSAMLFFLLLYKTFNLPYTATMMAQEGILQGLYLLWMLLRVRGGKTANRVLSWMSVDIKFDMDGRIHPRNTGGYFFFSIFPGDPILCAVSGSDPHDHHHGVQCFRVTVGIFFLLAIPELRKTTMI